MKAFYSKFFNPLIQKNTSKINHFSINTVKNFSSFKVEVNNGAINTFSQNVNNINLNWQLARTWVNPSGQTHLNTVSTLQSSENVNEECQISGEVKPYEFERFSRKYGLVISRESNVYVQDGVYNSKKVRLVTSDQQDAALFSQIFEQMLESNESPDVHFLLLTNNSQIGTNKRFVYFSKQRKTVLSNSRSIENLKKAIELI